MEKQSRGNCFEGLIYPKEYIRNYEIIREKYKPGKNINQGKIRIHLIILNG